MSPAVLIILSISILSFVIFAAVAILAPEWLGIGGAKARELEKEHQESDH